MTDPTLALLCDRLVSALAPRSIILFGSRARGTAQPDSDYDLLVVAESDLPLEDRMFQARRAVRDVQVPKDIVVVTPDEFRKYSRWVSGVVREAVEHGEVLYEAA
jgi:predicted nucleotidyltransferase